MKLCFDLLEKWISDNYTGSVNGGNSVELNITGIATYQPFDGLWELKMVLIFNIFFLSINFVGRNTFPLNFGFCNVWLLSPGVNVNLV